MEIRFKPRDDDPGDILHGLEQRLEQASEARVRGLEQLAHLQRRRAERLAVAAKRLAEGQGEQHPRVRKLVNAVENANESRHQLQNVAARAARQPRLATNEWAVFGRIVNKNGQPLEAMRVGLHAPKGSLGESPPDTESDEYGDFHLRLPITGVFSKQEETPLLTLRLTDRQGKLRFESEHPLMPQPGTAAYFEIVLDE